MYFLTFYSEGPQIDGGYDLREINQEVLSKISCYFEKCFSFNKRTLKELPNSEKFCNSFYECLEQNPNANKFGYFDFKYFLIDYVLKQIPENSILLYHDCNFIRQPQYWQSDWQNIENICKKMLDLNQSDFFCAFEGGDETFVKRFVKEYTLDYFFNNEEKQKIKNCRLINAAKIVIRNNNNGRKFIEDIMNLCLNKDLISKSPNTNQDPSFQWSCGDQDVLNCYIYRQILDGQLNKNFPRFSFLYRIFRIENVPFMWFDRLHNTGISEVYNKI